MKLYLLRHADADARDDEKYPDDALRPLIKKGLKKIDKVVKVLKDADIQIDKVLTSPTVRTMETAERMANGLELPGERVIACKALRPEGERSELISEIKEKHLVDALMIVGHEPNLSLLISQLISGDESIAIHMKKTGLCCLTIEELSDGKCAVLEWLLDATLL